MLLEHSIDRAPVDARALHPNVCHSRFTQPVPQRFQVPRHGAKRPHLLVRLRPRRADQKARHDRLLMHVQTTAPLDDRLHHRLLPSEGDRDAAGTFETLLCVLPVPGGDKEWYLYAARAGLPIGVASHRSFVSLSTIARCEGSDKSARAATIFTDNGAPQALVACQGRSHSVPGEGLRPLASRGAPGANGRRPNASGQIPPSRTKASPSQTKQTDLDFLGFLRPIRGFSMGYEQSKSKRGNLFVSPLLPAGAAFCDPDRRGRQA